MVIPPIEEAGQRPGPTKEPEMTYPTTMREYYRRIVGAGRHGTPTIQEARADYRRAIDAQLSVMFLRI